jgi:subtilisin-like proprotein convertase family protein
MFPIKPPRVRVIALAIALGAVSSALAADSPDISPKEQMHLDMIALAYQMRDLRPEMATSPAAAALYEQLQAAYKRMSDELGGDDPGRTILSGTHDNSADARAMRSQAAPPPSQRTPLDEGGIAGTFATPPGCQASPISLFSNGSDFPIPDLGTVTSTIFVNGPAGRLWFVDVQLDISHTFNADLDITLTSPNGTTITLSTDNGGGNDNVFLGTVFVDDADPDGQVPYFSNNGLVTDHLYQNGVTAGPLVPEEPLHTFAGEDSNGVWTLRITDDEGVDVGTLLGWDIFVLTTSDPTNRTTRTFSNNGTGTVDSGVLVRNVSVAGMGGFLCDVQVRLNVTSASNEDLDISLTSPGGKVITLITDNGGSFDNGFAGTTFDDSVDPGAPGIHSPTDGTYTNLNPMNVLTPEESFASLRGTDANGTWSLRLSDDLAGFPGTFHSVSLILTTCSCGGSCPGDTNGDGFTDVDDLVGVILGWGMCP